MRRVMVVLCALTIDLAMTTPSYAHVQHSPICWLDGSHGRHWARIVADSKAEIYKVRDSIGTWEIYGYIYGQRPRSLGFAAPAGYSEAALGENESPVVTHLMLNGAIAAYESATYYSTKYSSGPSDLYVMVVDLDGWRTIHRVPTGSVSPLAEAGSVGSGQVTAITVKADGSAAWIAENYQETRTTRSPYYQVHTVDNGGEQLMASGKNVAPGSLALAGSTVYWTQEGKAFSAPLD